MAADPSGTGAIPHPCCTDVSKQLVYEGIADPSTSTLHRGCVSLLPGRDIRGWLPCCSGTEVAGDLISATYGASTCCPEG